MAKYSPLGKMAYLCLPVTILERAPGRIPKPCVVGSNPTGGAPYLPLSSRIPPVTGASRPTRPDRPGGPPAASCRLGNKAAIRSPLLARPQRCGESCKFVDGGWALIAQPIRHFRDPQMSRPAGAIQTADDATSERTIPLCVCPMHLNYRAAGCANEFQTFGRKPPLKFLGVGACRLG